MRQKGRYGNGTPVLTAEPVIDKVYRTEGYVRCSRYVTSRRSPEYCLSYLRFGRYNCRSCAKGIPSSSWSFGRDIAPGNHTQRVSKDRDVHKYAPLKGSVLRGCWTLHGIRYHGTLINRKSWGSDHLASDDNFRELLDQFQGFECPNSIK